MCVTIVATPIAINTPHSHCKCKRQAAIDNRQSQSQSQSEAQSIEHADMQRHANFKRQSNRAKRANLHCHCPLTLTLSLLRDRQTVCLCFGRRNVYLRTYLGVECVVLQLSNCLGINKMACSSNNVNVQQIPKQTNRRRRSGGSHWQRR